MFVLQDNKLYIQDGKALVGVSIYPDLVKEIKSIKVKQKPTALVLTGSEMKAKFNITDETPYIFPQEKKEEKKEVIEDATSKTKKSTGKSKRK